MTAPVEVPIARERGWGRVMVALVAFLVLPVTPLLRVLLPVDQTLLLLAPALAACAIAGWFVGGRPVLALLWTGLAAWALWLPGGGNAFAWLVRGIAVLVAALFAATTAWEIGGRFLTRAMLSISVALAVGGLSAAIVPSGTTRIRDAVSEEIGTRATAAVRGWREMTSGPEWRDLVARNPDVGPMSAQVEQQLAVLPKTATLLFPAMLALELLAALAVAWSVYHRVGRARIGPPLAALREFRFNDQFVWGLIGGLALWLVPGVALAGALGSNLLMVFGTLYAIRGMGVALWVLAPGRLMSVLLVITGVLFWNVLGVLALGLGLGDTWLDWRSRARSKT
ncbi:MAG: YybS family protein [Gemmatimonadaceae bacterium]|nr:YybS family protein [Gemmatimonadaceae bacterium]